MGLADDALPPQVDGIGIFFFLDELEMQVVVLLDEPFVFLLERDQSLCVELGFLGDNGIFVLYLLECFGRLNYFVQEALDQSC